MRIEVDQSGKVENTASKTILADSLGNSLIFSSKNKKTIQTIYRKAERPRMFVYELFSLLAAVLIRKSYKKSSIYIIDVEYYHQDEILRKYILHFLRKMKVYPSKDQITFASIGKESEAHKLAYWIHKRKKKGEKLELTSVLKYVLQ